MEDPQAADFRLHFGAIITLGIGIAGLERDDMKANHFMVRLHV